MDHNNAFIFSFYWRNYCLLFVILIWDYFSLGWFDAFLSHMIFWFSFWNFCFNSLHILSMLIWVLVKIWVETELFYRGCCRYQTGALTPLLRWLSQSMQRAAQPPRPAVRAENVPAAARQGNDVAGNSYFLCIHLTYLWSPDWYWIVLKTIIR